jgi:hypothetical protein
MSYLLGYSSVVSRAATGTIPTVARSHPLAKGLQAAYYPGVFPDALVPNLVSPGNGDMTTQGGTATPLVTTPEGPGIDIRGTGTSTRNVYGPAPTGMLQNSEVTLFVRGQWGPGTGGANQPQNIFGITYTGTPAAQTSPYEYFSIISSDGSQAQCIGAAYASSPSTFTNPTYTGSRTLTSGQMVSAAAVFPGTNTATGTPIVYQNGIPYLASVGSDMGFYGASPQIHFGGSNNTRNSSFIPTVAYGWNRLLGDGEMQYLHANPYSLLQWPIDLVMSAIGRATVPPVGVGPQLPILWPLAVAGGGLEWLGRRKMKLGKR